MKTALSLQQLAAELERQQATKRDFLVPPDSILFTTDPMETGSSRSTVSLDGVDVDRLPLSEITHSQFAERLKMPKRFYDRLRFGMPDLLDTNVNRLLRHHPDGPPSRWLIRTLDGEARAALSDQYARIDNFDIASMALPILRDIGGEDGTGVQIRSCAVTERFLHLKATLPRVRKEVKVGDVVSAGVYIRNSEIGYGKFVICPFVERLACSNGMVVMKRGEGMMERIHLGRRLDCDDYGHILSVETREAEDRAFMLRARDVISAAVDEARFHELVADMSRAAESDPIREPAAAIELFAEREGLTEAEGRSILYHLASGGELSQWGFVNAVTRTAEDSVSYDRATELETLGGKVLYYPPRDWAAVANAVTLAA